jgi:hypothetical protein
VVGAAHQGDDSKGSGHQAATDVVHDASFHRLKFSQFQVFGQKLALEA